MKTLLLSLIAVMMTATTVQAQSDCVTTLYHDGQISVFEGYNGYTEAMDAAVDGDIINLSSGRFKAVDITKAIRIRGAGYKENTESMVFPTILEGDFNISVSKETDFLSLEGIRNGNTIKILEAPKNVEFTKCRFYAITSRTPSDNFTILHSYITSILDFEKNCKSTNVSNSYITLPLNSKDNNGIAFNNCIVTGGAYNSGENPLYHCTFSNCILYPSRKENGFSFVIAEGNEAYNCVGYSSSMFKHITNTSNMINTDLVDGYNSAMFKPGTFYELTEESKNQYRGSDNTEVGLYGGNLPFNSMVANPQITRFEVAKKTSNDLLDINVRVQTAE